MPERSTSRASVPRKRLTADEARKRILQAAAKKLAEVGPEGLRLTELASELGISHPAILHHFGSREDLVGAVVERAMEELNQRLARAVEDRLGGGREAVLDLIAEFYGTSGHARLIAWLVLSGRAARVRMRGGAKHPLRQVIEVMHARRVRTYPERAVDFEDSKFRSQLTSLALLGDAIFGDLIRYLSGDATGPDSARAFRRRLAKLLADAEP